MTSIAAERPTYVGSRRFSDRPAEVRRARHRHDELFALVVAYAFADVAVALWSATMSPRAVARLIVVAGVAVLLLLGFGALILGGPGRAAPAEQVVTPSLTPYPAGWTYAP